MAANTVIYPDCPSLADNINGNLKQLYSNYQTIFFQQLAGMILFRDFFSSWGTQWVCVKNILKWQNMVVESLKTQNSRRYISNIGCLLVLAQKIKWFLSLFKFLVIYWNHNFVYNPK